MKKIILFVALPLPILVFFFLKMFGNNEFEIPVYYSEGVDRYIAGCPGFAKPYVVPDSVLTSLGWTGDRATMLILNDAGIKDNLNRVKDLFNEGDYKTLYVNQPTTKLKNCVLLSGDSSRVVLIDDKRQIRGYYTPINQKETDRLGVEIRILLKQYGENKK